MAMTTNANSSEGDPAPVEHSEAQAAEAAGPSEETPAPEAAPEGSEEPEERAFATFATGVETMLLKLDSQIELVRAKIEAGASERRTSEALYEELKEYKEKLLYGLQRPLLNDLLLLYDTVEGQLDHTPPESRERFEFVRRELLEILFRQDIEPMANVEPKVDRVLHRVVKVEPTDDPTKDRVVAKVVRRGFLRGEKVFRPEDVVAFRFEPPRAPEGDPNQA